MVCLRGGARRTGCMAYVCACAVFNSWHPEHRLTLCMCWWCSYLLLFILTNALHEMFMILIFNPLSASTANRWNLCHTAWITLQWLGQGNHCSCTFQFNKPALFSLTKVVFFFYFKSLETSKVIRVSIGL